MSDKHKETRDGLWWAEYFMATMKENNWTIEDIDVDLMLGWFANAQMWMHDFICEERDTLRQQVKELEHQVKIYKDEEKISQPLGLPWPP